MNRMLESLARKMSRFAIAGLMKYIVITMGAVFVMDLLFQGMFSYYLAFSLPLIMAGEVWRIISFIFIPIGASPIFIFFVLYFYWMIGQTLEHEWGAARFNLFYLIGVVLTILGGLITGYTVNTYLNLSLFMAFAILFPNFEIRLFFVLPVKVKWLGYLDAAFFLYVLIAYPWAHRIAVFAAIVLLALFFARDLKNNIVQTRRRRHWNNHFH